ncbi:antitoxin [Streptomyces sp. M19]
MGIMDKLKNAMQKSPDKTKQAVDKAADTADKKTGGKYSDQIDKGRDAMNDRMGRGGDRDK